MSAPVTDAPMTSVDGPYVGLRNFTEDHAPFFFGRDQERKSIIGNLQVARFTLLYAESGVGKSSLLRAGVMPRLRELAAQARAEGDSTFDVPVIFSSWTASPTEALIGVIEEAARSWSGQELTLPRDSLETAIVAATDAIGANLIVILDQFEEYVSNQARVGTDDAFPEQLAQCLNASGLRAAFLISIREDAYARIGELLKSRVPNVYANYLHLDYLDEAEARDAVVKPVERWNDEHPGEAPYSVEPALVDAVVSQVRLGAVTRDDDASPNGQAPNDGTTQVETTYLQLVLKRLWDEETGTGSRVLRLATLERLGGAEEIIGTHLDSAMETLPRDQQEVAAIAFRYLVTTSGMKVAYTVPDLADMSDRPVTEFEPVCRRLAGADLHILRAVAIGEPGNGVAYEIFHDALAQPIRTWRDGRELAAAKAEVRRQRRRQAVLGAVALVLVGLLVAVLALYRHSEDLQRSSESAKFVSQALAEGANPQRSLELAKRAIEAEDTPEARLAVRTALAKPYVERVFSEDVGEPSEAGVARTVDGSLVAVRGPKGAWVWDPRRQTKQHLAGVTARGNVFFSGDGTRVVAFDTNKLQVFDTKGKALGVPVTPDAGGYFVWAGISPAGDRVALVPADSTVVTIRSVDDGTTLGTLVHDAFVASVVWTPDGKSLVTTSNNGAVTVWNADFTQRGPAFRDAEAYTFSADGVSLAVVGTDHVVRVVRLADLSPTVSFPAGDQVITTATFGLRDANLLAVGDHTGTMRVFDLRDPGAPPTVVRSGTANAGVTLAAAPFVLTAGAGSLSIWDASQGVPIETFEISGQIFDARLGDDGTYSFLQVGWVEQGDAGHRVPRLRLWTGRTGSTVGALGPYVLQSSFTHDGRHLNVVYRDGPGFAVEVRRYPSLEPAPRVEPSPAAAGLDSAAHTLWIGSSGDGKTLVTLMYHPGTPSAVRIEVWDPATGEKLRELSSKYPHGDITAMALSPDGNILSVTGYDRTITGNNTFIELFPVNGSSASQSVVFPPGTYNAMTFSQDGKVMVIGSSDGTVWLFELFSKNKPTPLKAPGPDSKVQAVAVSRDSKLIATGSEDGRVVLWDRKSRDIMRTFELDSPIVGVDFDARGKFIVADRLGRQTVILNITGDEGRNAVMLSDPIPEPADQSVAFDPVVRQRPTVVSSNGRYIVRYPCVACVSRDALIDELDRRLARANAG